MNSNTNTNQERPSGEKAPRQLTIREETEKYPNEKEILCRHLPWTYDEAYAKELECHIVKNRSSLKKIEIISGGDGEAAGLYLKAVVRGISHCSHGDNSSRRALDHLIIDGIFEIDRIFEIGSSLLTRIIRYAPRHLRLDFCTFGRVANEDSGDEKGSDADCCRKQGSVECWCWKCCQLQKFVLNQDDDDNAAMVLIFRALSNVSTLKDLSLFFGLSLEEQCKPQDASEAMVSILESNPLLHTLTLLYDFQSDAIFCNQLQNHEALRLFYADFFDALAETLKTKNVTLKELGYRRECTPSIWGPSSVEYYVSLNKYGRKKMRSASLSGKEFVRLLSRLCLQPSISTTGDRDSALDAWAAEELFCCPWWASSEEERLLKVTGLLYGLLRESPGVWSNAAVNSAESKPAAKAKSCPPGKNLKRKASSMPNISKKKKS